MDVMRRRPTGPWRRGRVGGAAAVATGWPPGAEAVAMFALALVVAIAVNAILRHQVGVSGDEPYYARIAAHPAGPHNFPYAFRVGVPYLVHVLPFAQRFSWEALALVFAAIASSALFTIMRDLGAGRGLAAWLAIGYVVSPELLVVFLRNGIEVDPAIAMILALGTLFILRRRRLALLVTILAGTVVHESCLFLIPLAYAMWARRALDLDAARDVVLVALLPVAAYLDLRATIAAVGEHYQPGYEGPFLTERVDVLRDGIRGVGWTVEARRIALAYGPLWAVLPFTLQSGFVRRGLVLVALCLGSMTFGLDWGRMIFFAAPVVYGGCAQLLAERRRLAIAVVACLLLVDAGYAVYMQVHGVVHGLDSTGPPARGPVS